jgi:hypothetical protein
MGDPKRLRDSLTPRAFERVLLDSALGPGPTNEQCDALWAAVQHKIVPGGGGESAASTSNGSSGSGVTAAGGKTLAGGLVHGALLLGIAGAAAATTALARWGTTSSAPPESARPAAIARPVSSAAQTETESDPPQSGGAAATEVAVPFPAISGPPTVAPRRADGSVVARPGAGTRQAAMPGSGNLESPLRAESALLLQVHEALLARECARALALVDDARQRFPNGVLAQEREAFGVQALACAGRNDEAADHAAAFLRDYPTSPHAAVVRRFLR